MPTAFLLPSVALGRSAADADRWPAPTSARLLLLLTHQQHPALCLPQSAAAASAIITQLTLADDNS
jgi:hypothetical protein